MQARIASAAVSALIALQAQAAQTEVAVSRSEGVYRVEARSVVDADRDTVWKVLTSYEKYPDFVPGLRVSRVVAASPLHIEQVGEFGVLFFRREVRSLLEIDERPPSRILFRSLDGDLTRLDTDLTITGEGTHSVVHYQSVIAPGFWVPPLIGSSIMRVSIRNKLQAVAEEIERRAATSLR
jgi:carbon monoxide dehydrogenase subunit G